MSTCNDCLHAEICPWDCDGVVCEHFKDSSKFFEMPCKVGDTVYFIGTNNINKLNSGVIEVGVEKLVLKSGGVYMKLSCNAVYETSCRSIGKTIFLTKAEAEKALAERSKEE